MSNRLNFQRFLSRIKNSQLSGKDKESTNARKEVKESKDLGSKI